MKRFLKNIAFGILSLLPSDASKASILMYHSVGENTAEFTVSPKRFEQHLRYLVDHKYKIVSLSSLVEFLRTGRLLRSSVSLTFDDGYEDMYTVVFPLIQELNIPISIFLTTGHVGNAFSTSRGDTIPMLSWEQIRTMHESGLVEFLPHGRMHHSLSILSYEEAKAEIQGALADLEEKLGTVPRIYAYAKGKYSAETIRILANEGYLAAVTVRPGRVDEGSPLFELPRNGIGSETTLAEFKSRVSGSASWYEGAKSRTVPEDNFC